MHRLEEAGMRLRRLRQRKQVISAARERSPQFDVAYALLRRTVQALSEVQMEIKPYERKDFDSAWYHLHHAEDAIVRLLGFQND